MELTFTVQPKMGPSVKASNILDLVDLAHYVASVLTDCGLPQIYTSGTAEALETVDSSQFVLDLSVDTFQIIEGRNVFDNRQFFAVVELSITLRHFGAKQQALGKRVVRRRDPVSGDNAQTREALHRAAKELARIVAHDIEHGNFDAALRNQPERAEWDARLLDAQETSVETCDHSAAWYRAAASARRGEILSKAAETRRREAQRRLNARAIDEERQQIAAYGFSRYKVEASALVEMLRQHDEKEFRLLQEAIRAEEESDVR
jgi:hypothetical protein